MTGDERCRWHEDPNGRCGDPAAFPGDTIAPPFCVRHIARLEPWISTRAASPSDAAGWIAWARRRAGETDDTLRALGLLRPARALDDGRPVTPNGPERR